MNINFNKDNGLVPAVIQEETTGQVLMVGYMNQEAYAKTVKENRVTFFSRSKNRLWTKGETSGNYLEVEDILLDCDSDALLIKVIPNGPTCHTGSKSCFKETTDKGFLYALQRTINERLEEASGSSYTRDLFEKGVNKIAQKVGEEAVELVIEAKDDNEKLFKDEAADLLYHFLVLLRYKKLNLEDIESVLAQRQNNK